MDLKLEGKTIMIAAGSRGLGYGVAEACAREKATVFICSRQQAKVDQAIKELRQIHNQVYGHVVDVQNHQQILHWRDQVLAQTGRIDGLLINAGGPPAGKFDDFEEDDWQVAFNLSLMSAVRMLKAVLPSMKAQKSGAILTITSSSIKEPIDSILLSNVMRAGVVALVKSLSRDLSQYGIRVNNIVPGVIYTDRITQLAESRAVNENKTPAEVIQEMENPIPLGRFGSIQEFGRTGAFLLSEAASYTTGASYFVDGGSSRTLW